MNIISASRRTDIPAWYGDWFMNRIEAGEASYRNPFSNAIHKVSLKVEDVITFVFWTKNVAPFTSRLKQLLEMGYKAYFQYTVTGFGGVLESGVPSWRKTVKSFKDLSDLLGSEAVRWRYDPIVIAPGYNRDFHLNNFETILSSLEGYTKVCHISFVQFYKKTVQNFKTLSDSIGASPSDPDDEDKISLALELKDMAVSRGITLQSCCYPMLNMAGIDQGACVDSDLVLSLRPDLGPLRLKPNPTRKGCRCCDSRDIGGYDTCIGGCIYCYATQNHDTARKKHSAHRPEDSFL